MMIALAIPVVASSLITNVTNIIDAGMLRARLASIMNDPAAAGIMKSMYAESLLGTGTPDDSVTDYLYGCYSAAINFKNPGADDHDEFRSECTARPFCRMGDEGS